MSSDEEECFSANEKQSPMGDFLVEILQEQDGELCTSERTIDSIIADLQGAPPIAGLQRLQEELTEKSERLKTFIRVGLPRFTDQSGYISDARRLKEQCLPPPSELIQELRRGASGLMKVWDVVKTTSVQHTVPYEYHLNTRDAHSSDVMHIPVEIVIRNDTPTDTATGGQQVQRVMVTPQSTAIILISGPVRVNTITDDKIQRTRNNVLITKIDWAEELARVQELRRKKQSLVRQLEREQARGQQQQQQQQQQQEARERAERQLADLYHRHKEEEKKEHERVKTFYMGIVRGRSQLLKKLTEKIRKIGCIRDVIQHLFEDFNIRLLGIDSGLRFLMDVPVEEYEEMLKQQDAIKKLLEQALLPKQKVEWTQATQWDLQNEDLQLGQPLPVSGDATALADSGMAMSGASFDPMTATPRRVFMSHMAADGNTDRRVPRITAIVVTQDGRLVMADRYNQMVKVTDMKNPDTVLGVEFDDKPWALALLQDGLVAMTTHSKNIYLVDVSDRPRVVSRVQTARQYWGVSAGNSRDTLIVSCKSEGGNLASVDVITRNGDVTQKVIDSSTLKELVHPTYLCMVDKDVLVSHHNTHTVYRVELATGDVVATLTHPDMNEPQQVCVDPSGDIYIACCGSKCVLVMSADGQWRRLLDGSQHGDEAYVRPITVCVAGSHIVVSLSNNFHTVVAGYVMDQ